MQRERDAALRRAAELAAQAEREEEERRQSEIARRRELEAELARANARAAEERRAADALAVERTQRLAELARIEEEATQRRIADERARVAAIVESQAAQEREADAAAAHADELRRQLEGSVPPEPAHDGYPLPAEAHHEAQPPESQAQAEAQAEVSTDRTPTTVPAAEVCRCTSSCAHSGSCPRPESCVQRSPHSRKRVARRSRWGGAACGRDRVGDPGPVRQQGRLQRVLRPVGNRHHGRGTHRRTLAAAARLSFRRTSARGVRRDVGGLPRLPRTRRLHMVRRPLRRRVLPQQHGLHRRAPGRGLVHVPPRKPGAADAHRAQAVALSPDHRRRRHAGHDVAVRQPVVRLR